MSKTMGQARPASYQKAKPVSARDAGGTSLGTSSTSTTAVAPSGESVRMRVVPRPPRQSADEARTG